MENDEIIENPEQKSENTEQPVNEQTEPADRTETEVTFWNKIKENQKLYKLLKVLFVVSASILTVILLFLFVIYAVPAMQEIPSGGKTHIVKSTELINSAPYKKQISQMNRDIERFSRKYLNYTTGQSYIVINTTDNQFYLYRNKKLIRQGHCSSGSYKMLKTESGRSWVFKTPKGKFTIVGKTTHPYWYRPDWSFVEEGLPIPSKDDQIRFEYGVLGDYALALGEGYLIHGTIWKRLLGMPVTHGCVRLNDDDLKAVFNALSLGSKVYIF
jgi:lipoprotein-anchoring transpeptidase ErfK/SrfK